MVASSRSMVKPAVTPERNDRLVEFRLEMGLPVWRYQFEGVVFEKRLLCPICRTPCT